MPAMKREAVVYRRAPRPKKKPAKQYAPRPPANRDHIILRMRSEGYTVYEIATMYNIDPAYIWSLTAPTEESSL